MAVLSGPNLNLDIYLSISFASRLPSTLSGGGNGMVGILAVIPYGLRW
jgi:hypothetical protein